MMRSREQWDMAEESHETSVHERLATGLGWFSLGLGAAELLAPGAMARMIGLNDTDKTRRTLQFYGLREIAAGVGILAQPGNPMWLWSRFGGDLLDLSSLYAAEGAADAGNRKLFATAAVVGATALDAVCAAGLSQSGESSSLFGEPTRAREAITIADSPERIYNFWRDFQNLPRFMRYLESVEPQAGGRSHWRARGPAGAIIEWDAELTADHPTRMIAWRSLDNADIYNAGTVRFEKAPANRGAVVHVDIEYSLPGGRPVASIARLFGMAPQQLIRDDLRRLKQIIEVGEVVHSDASIHWSKHPARPARELPEELRLRSSSHEPIGM